MSARLTHAPLLFAVLAGGIVAPGVAVADEPPPTSAMAKPLSPEMRAIAVDERRDEKIDGSLTFTGPDGELVHARDWFDGERPVLLTLNYYHCRVVCSVQLGGLANALSELNWTPGDEHFRVVTVSLDSRETAKDAQFKKTQILEELGRGPDVDWQFLRGDALAIQTLAAQLGISYAYDAEQDQFAHPAVAVFLMPDGTIAQYLYGLTYESRDIKFALMEAGQGRIGSPMEKLYQSCFTYDHTIGRYGPFAFGIMRIGGTLTFLIVAGTLIVFFRRERKRAFATDADDGRHAEAVS
jgi:protein SCO1/2